MAVPARCPKISVNDPSLSFNCASATTSNSSFASNVFSSRAAVFSNLALVALALASKVVCLLFSEPNFASLARCSLLSANWPCLTISNNCCGVEGLFTSSSTASSSSAAMESTEKNDSKITIKVVLI